MQGNKIDKEIARKLKGILRFFKLLALILKIYNKQCTFAFRLLEIFFKSKFLTLICLDYDFMLFSSLIAGLLACLGRFNRFLINAKYRPGFRWPAKA
jgi:hypothetical protein